MNSLYKTLKTLEGFTKNYKRLSRMKTTLTVILAIYTVLRLATVFARQVALINN